MFSTKAGQSQLSVSVCRLVSNMATWQSAHGAGQSLNVAMASRTRHIRHSRHSVSWRCSTRRQRRFHFHIRVGVRCAVGVGVRVGGGELDDSEAWWACAAGRDTGGRRAFTLQLHYLTAHET